MKYLLTARTTTGQEDKILFDEAPTKEVSGGQITYTGLSDGEETEMTITTGYYSMWRVVRVPDDYQLEPAEAPAAAPPA